MIDNKDPESFDKMVRDIDVVKMNPVLQKIIDSGKLHKSIQSTQNLGKLSDSHYGKLGRTVFETDFFKKDEHNETVS
jgi:hypothetical protein